MFYDRELQAIKRANRYRKREIFGENLLDFASNDYLGLSKKRGLFKKACKRVLRYKFHSPKASTLVNGYHPIHKEFENYISKINGFEKATTLGSGFLANISLFEALPRRGDLLLFDEEFHASGLITKKMSEATVDIFKHNDYNDLKTKIKKFKNFSKSRVIIAVEGIYSMSGDMVKKEIFDIADSHNAILIVDEAHSVGIVGKHLLGIFEYYGIKPKKNHIKMGTLGKALGSYGAYILSSKEIYNYLCNRAKAIIYTTAPSIFDIALAHENFLYIEKNLQTIKNNIKKIKKITSDILGIKPKSLILPIELENSQQAIKLKQYLLSQGFIVGAIRPPTVKKPILRVILRLKEKKLKKLLRIIQSEVLS